jgi:hypothetical protein
MPKKTTGRKSRLTRDVQEQLTNYIKRGHFETMACAACGIAESTYFRWKELGEDHLEDRAGKKVLVKARSPYREFREAVEKAKAQARMVHIENIRSAAFDTVTEGDRTKIIPKNWTASAWFLERTAPEMFGRRDTVVEGKTDDPARGEPKKKVVRFGGRYRPDGHLQTSANADAD